MLKKIVLSLIIKTQKVAAALLIMQGLSIVIAYADITVANVSPMTNPKIGYFYSLSPKIADCENTQLQFNREGNAIIPQRCLDKDSSGIEVYAENQLNSPITDSSCTNLSNTASQIWVSYSANSITCQSF